MLILWEEEEEKREKSESFYDRMPTFLTKSDETILKSIKIDQEILMRKKIVVRLHLLPKRPTDACRYAGIALWKK